MYVVVEGVKMSARVQRVLDAMKGGGVARYALERNRYTGREQFEVRVLSADRLVVKGLGYRAVHDAIALGFLVSRPVPAGSAWAQEWVLKDG